MSWKWVAAVVGLFVAYLLIDATTSSYTLADYAARPVVGLERGEARVPVAPLPTSATNRPAPVPEGAARWMGGEGVPLGYRNIFLLPEGATVNCTHVVAWMWCAEGWRPIRGAPRSPDNGGEVGGDVTRHVE